jgi:hypothetical protein
MVASLPWYDGEATGPALDAFWQCAADFLRNRGVDHVPNHLLRHKEVTALWQTPGLIVSQCCGPDLFTREGAALCVVARPAFATLDCAPGSYYSHIVSRTTQPDQHARIAVNSLSSRSGHLALTEWMKAKGISIAALRVSGSHQRSLAMLEAGSADLMAIDAHTMDQFNCRPKLPIIGRSDAALAPPYVFHQDSEIEPELLFSALNHAVLQCGETIGLAGLIRSQRADYRHCSMDANALTKDCSMQ